MILGKLNISMYSIRNGPQNHPFCPGSPQNLLLCFLRYFKTRFVQTYLFKSKIWKAGNLKVWTKRAPKNNRDLSSQKCFNFRGVLIGDKNRWQTQILGNWKFCLGTFAWELLLQDLRLGELGSWGWGNRLTATGGTRGRRHLCLPFKTLSKNPSR